MDEPIVLSVIVPVYNERSYVTEVLRSVQDQDLPGVTIRTLVVDDGSTDGTGDLLRRMAQRGSNETYRGENGEELSLENVRFFFHEENRGKGACLRTGFEAAGGDVVVVQDADLEYDPAEYESLLEPIRQGKADVVYGSRFLGGPQRVLYFWHYFGNNVLTTLSNMLTNLNLSDMETCYKMIRRDLLEEIEIREDRFGVEPELTAKLARRDCSIYEVPISYYGRTYEEGKKIDWRDGVRALWCIVKYNLFP